MSGLSTVSNGKPDVAKSWGLMVTLSAPFMTQAGRSGASVPSAAICDLSAAALESNCLTSELGLSAVAKLVTPHRLRPPTRAAPTPRAILSPFLSRIS